jgi:hypothetical protein
MAEHLSNPTNEGTLHPKPPNPFSAALNYGFKAAFAALLCCVAPAILVLFGLMGGVTALSFTGWFYQDDGSASWAGWLLRIAALGIGVVGIFLYRRKQNQCSIDKHRRRKNLGILIVSLGAIAIAAFLALDRGSTWVFEKYVTPLQQEELVASELQAAREAHALGHSEGVRQHLEEAEDLVSRAATFTKKSGAPLFDDEALATLRSSIVEARGELLTQRSSNARSAGTR